MKDAIIKEIQQRINSATVNGKEEIASSMRELLSVVIPMTDFEEMHKALYHRHTDLKHKIGKLYLEA